MQACRSQRAQEQQLMKPAVNIRCRCAVAALQTCLTRPFQAQSKKYKTSVLHCTTHCRKKLFSNHSHCGPGNFTPSGSNAWKTCLLGGICCRHSNHLCLCTDT